MFVCVRVCARVHVWCDFRDGLNTKSLTTKSLNQTYIWSHRKLVKKEPGCETSYEGIEPISSVKPELVLFSDKALGW